MNITKLYEQFKKGTVSKDHFIKEARRNFSQWISPVTSFNDAITILKGKRLINEAHELTVYQMIDRISPYSFKKGMEIELAKQPIFNNQVLEETKAKVAKKLFKDPKAYDIIDSKLTKYDANMQMIPVKNDNFVDKNNGMKKIKGYNNEKANTKDSNKENKKGLPKGVKEFTQTPKKYKKVKVMETPGKPKTIKENFEYMDDQNNTASKFRIGMKVVTPIGIGEITQVVNDTISVLLDHGEGYKDFQANTVRPQEYSTKDERDLAFSKLPNLGSIKGDDSNLAMGKIKNLAEEKKDKIIERLKEYLKNKKLNKEAIYKKGKSVVVADSEKSKAVLSKAGFVKEPGTEDAK